MNSTIIKEMSFLPFFEQWNLHIFKFSQESLAKLTVGFFRRYIFMWMTQRQNCYIQHTCVKLHFLRSLQKEFLGCSRLKYERAKSNLPVFLYPLFLEDLKALRLHWSPGLTWCASFFYSHASIVSNSLSYFVLN